MGIRGSLKSQNKVSHCSSHLRKTIVTSALQGSKLRKHHFAENSERDRPLVGARVGEDSDYASLF